MYCPRVTESKLKGMEGSIFVHFDKVVNKYSLCTLLFIGNNCTPRGPN